MYTPEERQQKKRENTKRAQHLQKEIRVRAVEDSTGGALLIEFYTPVQIERDGPMLS